MCAAAALLALSSFAVENRPNVVVILCDDLVYGDVQCLNPFPISTRPAGERPRACEAVTEGNGNAWKRVESRAYPTILG